MFGNPETTTGGRALKFYATVRLDIRRVDGIKVSNELVGNRTKVKVVKNKVAPPFKTTEFDIMYGQGISREGDTLDMAAELDIINKSGAWYAYKNEKIGQGRENAKIYLKEHPEVRAEIEEQVRQHYGLDEESRKKSAEAKAAAEPPKEAPKPKKGKKAEIINEDNEDILIIPSDAYMMDDDDYSQAEGFDDDYNDYNED